MSEEKTKILIVDDDAELRELIAETLANYGYASESAKDGAEMFAALERGGFSLVLLDIMMPGEDGLSLCRRLRAPGTRWASLPVIFLTALQETTDKVVGLEIGGDDYLGKPFQARELIARVRALLRRASMSGAEPRTEAPRAGENYLLAFGNWKLNVVGPTTSIRMEPYADVVGKMGIRAVIGKGFTEIFEELYRFEQSSYDEEDAQDVDYGNAWSFIDAMISSGISAFFPIEPEKREEFPWNQPDFYEKEAAELVVLYADILYSFLYDDCAEDEHSAIEASIARSPLWLAETERIKSDLALVRDYPKNKETVLRRIAEYRELRTKPLCKD